VRLRFAADDRLVALVRAGDPTAFEILYDRHASELLSFCRYMLGSQADSEDAVQSTFASAHRALLADDRTIELRPWLFAIARNTCLSTLRARRPLAELPVPAQPDEDPAAKLEQREQMREVLATLLELPESQRVSLVLSELHGFSQGEIAAVLGVRADQVKSYIYQARSNLISEREARSADCDAIRHELAIARGPALLKSRLRRHLRSCRGCQQYAADLSRQRDQLGALLPVLPSLALKRRVLETALASAPEAGTYAGAAAAGGSVLATTAELTGGGAKALIAKLLAGVACLAAGTGAATVAVHGAAAPTPAEQVALVSRPSRVAAPTHEPVTRADVLGAAQPADPQAGAGSTRVGEVISQPATFSTERSQVSQDGATNDRTSDSPSNLASASGADGGTETHDKSEEAHGRSEEAHGKSEEAHGKSEEAAVHGKSEEAHGKGEGVHGKSEAAHGETEAHGRSEEAHGKSEEAQGHTEQAVVRGKSEEAHGKSEEPAPVGQLEAAHGRSEEAQGHAEEPPTHGKSEEAHGA
jgi:RNA polymerase sigma factor (sigma-70 family)